ncbi:AbrB/MazE/SpoVT family DNA-binding domain-containing protein [Lactiplantibacillus carotarum]|uniref:AbrB/MazE/SpoVT family DNA-binding domain-containing protein n=1 Tax=Lactiplantibacillus carotarum TaxID=2993456 RepID=UPI00298EF0D0|nr:AbrB/MazE/SpoVT family DNA-binding domain-containing protein [Lactiplantibacillus carotarum]
MTSNIQDKICYSLKVSSRGQVVLPAPVRRQLDLQPGDELQLTTNSSGEMLLKRKPSALDWSNLIKGLPTEKVDINEDGHFDEQAAPRFAKWMKGDDPDWPGELQ